MGEVIQFREGTGYARRSRVIDATSAPATVIILPVVRVERAAPDVPRKSRATAAGKTPGRRRRRVAR